MFEYDTTHGREKVVKQGDGLLGANLHGCLRKTPDIDVQQRDGSDFLNDGLSVYGAMDDFIYNFFGN